MRRESGLGDVVSREAGEDAGSAAEGVCGCRFLRLSMRDVPPLWMVSCWFGGLARFLRRGHWGSAWVGVVDERVRFAMEDEGGRAAAARRSPWGRIIGVVLRVFAPLRIGGLRRSGLDARRRLKLKKGWMKLDGRNGEWGAGRGWDPCFSEDVTSLFFFKKKKEASQTPLWVFVSWACCS